MCPEGSLPSAVRPGVSVLRLGRRSMIGGHGRTFAAQEFPVDCS